MTRVYLPQCEVCKYYEECVQKNIDKKSLFCMSHFYVEGFVWNYYSRHINEYAVSKYDIVAEIEKQKTL